MEPEFSVGQRVYVDCYDCHGIVLEAWFDVFKQMWVYVVKANGEIWELFEWDLEAY